MGFATQALPHHPFGGRGAGGREFDKLFVLNDKLFVFIIIYFYKFASAKKMLKYI